MEVGGGAKNPTLVLCFNLTRVIKTIIMELNKWNRWLKRVVWTRFALFYLTFRIIIENK